MLKWSTPFRISYYRLKYKKPHASQRGRRFTRGATFTRCNQEQIRFFLARGQLNIPDSGNTSTRNWVRWFMTSFGRKQMDPLSELLNQLLTPPIFWIPDYGFALLVHSFYILIYRGQYNLLNYRCQEFLPINKRKNLPRLDFELC